MLHVVSLWLLHKLTGKDAMSRCVVFSTMRNILCIVGWQLLVTNFAIGIDCKLHKLAKEGNFAEAVKANISPRGSWCACRSNKNKCIYLPS